MVGLVYFNTETLLYGSGAFKKLRVGENQVVKTLPKNFYSDERTLCTMEDEFSSDGLVNGCIHIRLTRKSISQPNFV
jgi:hypothetical protein